MGVLFVISDAPSTALELASEVARQGIKVSILFVGEARRHASEPDTIRGLEFVARIYCLMEDPSEPIGVACVEGIGYAGWVQLLEENERVVSWS
ncbi:MAG: hypothetical protein PVJ38_02765 [Candidatus Bathyarchaeota archaeon]|jgi:hypothetical protein